MSALQHLARCASAFRGISVAYGILNKIHNLALNGTSLKLQWVPSHIGLRGNEEADKLAKLSILDGNEYNLKTNYTEKLLSGKQLCYNTFKEYFDERSKEKGIWYKTIQCQPPRIPWFVRSKLSRSIIVMAHRIRSGHYPSRKFGFLMKKTDSPNCEVCNVLDDVYHILMDCTKFKNDREALMTDLKLNRLDLGTFINILSEPNSKAAISLYKIFMHQ